jgi:hypothetical protein
VRPHDIFCSCASDEKNVACGSRQRYAAREKATVVETIGRMLRIKSRRIRQDRDDVASRREQHDDGGMGVWNGDTKIRKGMIFLCDGGSKIMT